MARRGEIAHQMYFIARGTLSVLVPDNTKTKEAQADVANARAVSTLRLPATFGDVALIKARGRHTVV